MFSKLHVNCFLFYHFFYFPIFLQVFISINESQKACFLIVFFKTYFQIIVFSVSFIYIFLVSPLILKLLHVFQLYLFFFKLLSKIIQVQVILYHLLLYFDSHINNCHWYLLITCTLFLELHFLDILIRKPPFLIKKDTILLE